MISDGEDAEVDDDLVGVDSRDNNDQEDEPEIDEEHFSINHVEVIFFCTEYWLSHIYIDTHSVRFKEVFLALLTGFMRHQPVLEQTNASNSLCCSF